MGERRIERVLVANRGEIAVRILRTLRALGIESVAVHSEVDRSARHVLDADHAVSLGGSTPAESYLRADAVVQAAVATGADAVHPGYGLLSENAGFAEACEAAGIAFVGPTPTQLRTFGLKHTARALAEGAGVALAPGSGLLADVDEARAAAASIGFPLMLKASAGGGGIGMRVCRDEAELVEAFAAVTRLAGANFGDAGVLAERFVARARHVEVQVLGDGDGRIVTFPTRDCSLQRRNQKVVEETPAPGLPDGVTTALLDDARRLLSAVSYRSAGTVEFLVDADTGAHAFLEVNTRLQVEHGVTELVTGVDLVAEMLHLAGGGTLGHLPDHVDACGHAVEARVYAEDPVEDFRPSTGLLTEVTWPDDPGVRVDGWVEAGTVVTPFYDPLLAKVLTHGEDRDAAVDSLVDALSRSGIHGLETNVAWLGTVLGDERFRAGEVTTSLLADIDHVDTGIAVVDPGPSSSIQDLPGRLGYWNVGIPPSGPMDDRSFRLANRAVGNDETWPALELTQRGATLVFRADTEVALAGALLDAEVLASVGGAVAVPWHAPFTVPAGATLRLGDVVGPGCRTYLAVAGGFDVPEHLGSRATFALGGFGGHGGRTLAAGDVLRVGDPGSRPGTPGPVAGVALGAAWEVGVLSGPHGAPDFLTEQGAADFVAATWEVHFHSDRTGVRLLGPTPGWARTDGGEAGLHPSNLHDNAYAVGTVDLTGDMPIVLGPDGPSCGGFVCPFTVATDERWKLGQARAGDTVRFVVVDHDGVPTAGIPAPVLVTDEADEARPRLVVRRDGDRNVLLEFGPHELDLGLRLRIGALMAHLDEHPIPGLGELTPGVRSVQVGFDPDVIGVGALVDALVEAEDHLPADDELEVPSRIVHLPLSWDDPTAREAAERYARIVRPDAPWCPWNLEFIRRINGLGSVEDVRDLFFDASYLVLALGDVYLGAPVATPVDPRHRLVTTKYNPARTWTAENSVGIGGAYLCIYGMEGPGGYQLLGRTVQVWNRWRRTPEFAEPWLLRPFDQFRFHPVSVDELTELRADLPAGRTSLEIEQTSFRLSEHRAFLAEHAPSIEAFRSGRDAAFAEERDRWAAAGLDVAATVVPEVPDAGDEAPLGEGEVALRSPMAGVVARVPEPGQRVRAGEPLAWIEAMKTETSLPAPVDGTVAEVRVSIGAVVAPGTVLVTVAT